MSTKKQPKKDLYLLACQKLGKTPKPVLTDLSDSEAVHDDAAHRLRTCIAAENAIKQPDGTFKEWKAVYDGYERHYFPYHKKDPSGSGWAYDSYVCWDTSTLVGPRLEYRSYEIMIGAVTKLNPYYEAYLNS